MKRAYILLLSGVIAFATAAYSQSGDARINIGTLRCTLDPGTITEAWEPRNISCVFKPDEGVAANYEGVVKKLGDPAPTADKLVLLWSVFAQDESVTARQLEGTYVGTIENDTVPARRPLGALVGGPDSMIELHPLTRLPSTGSGEMPLVLELDLKSVRV